MLLFHVSETRALDASPLTMDDGRLPMHHGPWTIHHSPLPIDDFHSHHSHGDMMQQLF